jgi:hypothetical protein
MNSFKEQTTNNDFYENIKNIEFNGTKLSNFKNLNVSNITLNEENDY